MLPDNFVVKKLYCNCYHRLNTDLASVSFGQGDINRLISSTYDDVEKRSLIIITNGNDKDER